MANEVPGTFVPDPLLERMRQVEPAAAAAEGITMARAIAAQLRGAVQGFQVATHAGDIEAALAVLDGHR
jgi:hypothetical protein